VYSSFSSLFHFPFFFAAMSNFHGWRALHFCNCIFFRFGGFLLSDSVSALKEEHSASLQISNSEADGKAAPWKVEEGYAAWSKPSRKSLMRSESVSSHGKWSHEDEPDVEDHTLANEGLLQRLHHGAELYEEDDDDDEDEKDHDANKQLEDSLIEKTTVSACASSGQVCRRRRIDKCHRSNCAGTAHSFYKEHAATYHCRMCAKSKMRLNRGKGGCRRRKRKGHASAGAEKKSTSSIPKVSGGDSGKSKTSSTRRRTKSKSSIIPLCNPLTHKACRRRRVNKCTKAACNPASSSLIDVADLQEPTEDQEGDEQDSDGEESELGESEEGEEGGMDAMHQQINAVASQASAVLSTAKSTEEAHEDAVEAELCAAEAILAERGASAEQAKYMFYCGKCWKAAPVHPPGWSMTGQQQKSRGNVGPQGPPGPPGPPGPSRSSLQETSAETHIIAGEGPYATMHEGD